MALGAVTLSIPVSLFGSVYMSALNGFDLLMMLAAYSSAGTLTLFGLLLATVLLPTEEHY